MDRRGFSLIEMMVAVMILAVALVGIVGAIIWESVNVSVQDGKNKAEHITSLLLERMNKMPLDDIMSTNWDSWVKTNGHDYGLPGLSVNVTYPLVYSEEYSGGANHNGYTYASGNIWSGFRYPSYTKGLLGVNIIISWNYKNSVINYSSATILSEIGRSG